MNAVTSGDVDAYREIAALRSEDHITIRPATGRDMEVIISEVHAGDTDDITEAYATAVERHSRVRVTIPVHLVRQGVLKLHPGWRDNLMDTPPRITWVEGEYGTLRGKVADITLFEVAFRNVTADPLYSMRCKLPGLNSTSRIWKDDDLNVLKDAALRALAGWHYRMFKETR
jgi:hypothetical protein